MKKIFKIMLSIILCIACVSFMACGDGEGGDNPQTPTPTTHTITFNLGEYSNAQITATTLTVTEGKEYTLYTPTLEGYTFIKWQRDGVDFANTGTYTLKEDITLTPVFELNKVDDGEDDGGDDEEDDDSQTEITYTITFDLSAYPDAEITATTITVLEDSEYTLYIPTLEGYTFVQWNYYGEKFDNTGTYTIKANITLTPVFELVQDDPDDGGEELPPAPATYTITFNLGEYPNAQITATTLTVTEGEEYTLYTPTLEGYNFIKWQRDGVDFANTGTYTLNEDITLTPVFEVIPPPAPVNYTITFNLSGYPNAKITATTMTVVGGEKYTLYLPTLTGYTFVGWKYNGVDFANTGTYTLTKNITLTAVFKFDDNWVKEPEIK